MMSPRDQEQLEKTQSQMRNLRERKKKDEIERTQRLQKRLLERDKCEGFLGEFSMSCNSHNTKKKRKNDSTTLDGEEGSSNKAHIKKAPFQPSLASIAE